MLAHLGAMLAQLGAMLAQLEPYVGPACGLCWPMLTHLKPQEPKNGPKMRKSTKHRKTQVVFGGRVGRRQGARPLSPTERRETPSARTRPGGPWPDLRAAATAADPGTSNRGWLIFWACPTISNGPYFVFQTTSPTYLVSFLPNVTLKPIENDDFGGFFLLLLL